MHKPGPPRAFLFPFTDLDHNPPSHSCLEADHRLFHIPFIAPDWRFTLNRLPMNGEKHVQTASTCSDARIDRGTSGRGRFAVHRVRVFRPQPSFQPSAPARWSSQAVESSSFPSPPLQQASAAAPSRAQLLQAQISSTFPPSWRCCVAVWFGPSRFCDPGPVEIPASTLTSRLDLQGRQGAYRRSENHLNRSREDRR